MPDRITIDEFIQLVSGALAEMRALSDEHADASFERWFSALRETCDEKAEGQTP